MNLKPPSVSAKRLLARKLADATLSAIPVAGGHLAALYSVTHPSKIEQLTNQWQTDLTALVNDHESKINQLFDSIEISDLAASIGYWVSEQSEFGMLEPITNDAMQAHFADIQLHELEDACGELEHAGLATLSHFLGPGFRFRPTNELFLLFDSLAFEGIYPIVDATDIAKLVLEKKPLDGVSAEEIMEKFGWNERRLNPAMRIITDMIADGRKSQPINWKLDCRSFFADAKERAAIKHFLSKVPNAPTARATST